MSDKNQRWGIITSTGFIWPWTISWTRKEAITIACGALPHYVNIKRKSAWARLKRTRGLRVVKVLLTEVL